MNWKRYDDSGARWTWEADEERHFLALHDGELREYHEVPGGAVTVHVYVVHAEADVTTMPSPLDWATHMETWELAGEVNAPWVRALDDREVFEYLASAGYAS